MKVELDKLTEDQKRELMNELRKEEEKKEKSKQEEKKAYADMKEATIHSVFKKLQNINSEMAAAKENLLTEFHSLLDIKSELYGIKETQLSHNWTSKDGMVTIITGYNTIDRWDETVSAGVERVNNWLSMQSTDNNAKYINIIRGLLKPNKDGVLKASRVLDLQNQAEDIGDKELIEAVKLIREAHCPDKTSTYIKAKFKDENGNTQWLGLSMSAV